MVLLGWVTSPVVSRSVGDRPRPNGGGREVAVVKEIDGEGGSSLEVNQFLFSFLSVRF